MKEYKNIIIVGEKDQYVSMAYENMYKPIKYVRYNDLPSKGSTLSTNINALSIINRYLAEIYNNRTKNDNVHYFIIPNKICKAIKNGTYKNWIKTGKTANGDAIKDEELYQWIIFAALYKELFTNVDFKPISYYSMKEVKYNYKHMQFTKELINKAHEYLEEIKNNNFEDSLFNIIK